MKLPLFDSLHQQLGQVLDLQQTQHALTASNLANAETPGYRAKHIAFDDALSQVFASENEAMQTTHVGHIGANPDGLDPEVYELDPVSWSTDGNSVNTEAENVTMTENALMYEAVSQGMSKRLALLRFAASDGRA